MKSNNIIKRLLITTTLCGGVFFSPASALAAADDQAGFELEEIIVTARKRTESLQDTPVSVTAFSANTIESMSLSSLKELGQFTPNMTFSVSGNSGNNSSLVFIRGIGQPGTTVFWDTGVGIYVDGVFMARMQGIDLDLMDLERVEVLRGPQGTLFGKNTIGGAINIVSSRPDSSEFSGKAEVTYGQYDRMDGKIALNIPVIEDKLAISLAGATRNRDGFGIRINKDTGEKLDETGDRNRLSGRAKIALKASENLDVLFSFDVSRVREKNAVRDLKIVGTPVLVGLLNMFVDPDYNSANFVTASRYENYADGPNINNLDTWGVSLTLDWNLGGATFKSISAYRDMESLNGTDPDGSPYTIISLMQDMEQTQFSQEFQLSGLSFDDRFNWVAGLYYFEESGFNSDLLGVYSELYSAIGLDISFTRDIWADSKSYAVYGQGTFAVTENFDITAGLRYSYEEKKVARVRVAHVTGNISVPKDGREDDFQALSPKISLDYNWTDDVMTYVSVARGFKSGGLNGDSFDDFTFTTFDPEYVWTYEAGLRSEFLDHRLRINASAFYSDYTNIQFSVNRGDPDTGRSVAVVDNAGKAEMKGFEIEIVAMPVERLMLSASLGHIDAKYTELDSGLPITLDTDFIKTPGWSLALSGKYSIPLGDAGEMVWHVDWATKSDIQHDILSSPLLLQEAYSIMNARLTFQSADEKWAVSVFGTNITDTKYIVAGSVFTTSLGFAEVIWARPREWGISFKYNF